MRLKTSAGLVVGYALILVGLIAAVNTFWILIEAMVFAVYPLEQSIFAAMVSGGLAVTTLLVGAGIVQRFKHPRTSWGVDLDWVRTLGR